MKFATSLVLAALAGAVSAQNATYNASYVGNLTNYLNSIGLTSFTQAIQTSLDTPGTQLLLQNINGTAKTLLAPTNAAFAGLSSVYPNTTTNTTFLGDRLSYHLLSGNFTANTFAYSPNHTIARTYLNDSAYVQLEGNKTQVIAFSIVSNATRILNQNTQVTITNITTFQDLLIYIVDSVVDLPGTLSAAFTTANLTLLPSALTAVNYTAPLLNAHGITIFAPNDQALTAAQTSLASLNTTQIEAVLANHIINGTSVYSTLLNTGTYTTSGGQQYTFSTNSSGTWVSVGSASAQIVQSDVILNNGVLHVIDGVLANTNSSESAASSAYAAATSSAGSGGQQTGGVGVTPTETGPVGSTSTGSKKSGAVKVELPLVQIVAVLGAALGGAALLI